MNPKQLSRSIAVTVLLLVVTTAFAQRQMENLGRGVIAYDKAQILFSLVGAC